MMFSTREKQEISEKVQQILREMNHPELPESEIVFELIVAGKGRCGQSKIRNDDAAERRE